MAEKALSGGTGSTVITGSHQKRSFGEDYIPTFESSESGNLWGEKKVHNRR